MARIKFVPKLKESLYHVKVIGAKEKEGQYGLCLVFKFVVLDDSNKGYILNRSVSYNSEQNKSSSVLADFISAILGKNISEVSDVDTESLIGKRCIAIVQDKNVDRGGKIQSQEYISELRPWDADINKTEE